MERDARCGWSKGSLAGSSQVQDTGVTLEPSGQSCPVPRLWGSHDVSVWSGPPEGCKCTVWEAVLATQQVMRDLAARVKVTGCLSPTSSLLRKRPNIKCLLAEACPSFVKQVGSFWRPFCFEGRGGRGSSLEGRVTVPGLGPCVVLSGVTVTADPSHLWGQGR